MWPFNNKKTLLSSGVFHNMTDCHCHLLPGVDDGFREMDETLNALETYAKWGIREVWLTPHIMEDIPNTTDDLRQRFEKLKAEVKAKGTAMPQLHLAAENMLDSLFAERLAKKDLLFYGKEGNELLVETSYMQPPIGMNDMLKGIREIGITPVLAHPERYVYMNNDRYMQLRSQGIRFQLNVTSLSGAYGKVAQKKAEWLLENGFYKYKGTDCHNLGALTHAAKRKVLTTDTIEKLRYLN